MYLLSHTCLRFQLVNFRELKKSQAIAGMRRKMRSNVLITNQNILYAKYWMRATLMVCIFLISSWYMGCSRRTLFYCLFYKQKDHQERWSFFKWGAKWLYWIDFQFLWGKKLNVSPSFFFTDLYSKCMI